MSHLKERVIMTDDFVKHVKAMLLSARKIFSSSPLLVKETGITNVKGDHSIEMDVKIEKAFIDYLKEQKLPVEIFSEEIGVVSICKNSKYLVVFDPLDGSTNYKVGLGFLPFGVMIAVYKGLTPKIKDIVAAGAIEQTRNLGWIFDGEITTDLDGRKISLKEDWKINRSTPFYLDLYYKEGYKAYSLLPEKIFVRNTGSSIGNLSYVLSNAASGLGHVRMRPEEVGTVYSLIKGAGGIAIDHEGKDLGEKFFDTNVLYQILAGSEKVVEFVSQEI